MAPLQQQPRIAPSKSPRLSYLSLNLSRLAFSSNAMSRALKKQRNYRAVMKGNEHMPRVWRHQGQGKDSVMEGASVRCFLSGSCERWTPFYYYLCTDSNSKCKNFQEDQRMANIPHHHVNVCIVQMSRKINAHGTTIHIKCEEWHLKFAIKLMMSTADPWCHIRGQIQKLKCSSVAFFINSLTRNMSKLPLVKNQNKWLIICRDGCCT